jgi:high-affinity iron transporter
MLSSLIIVFREMLEMALVLGVLFAATKDMRYSRRWIGVGIVAGLSGALLFALFMTEVETSVNGNGEFLLNAGLLAVASLLIAWTVMWMSRHGREMSEKMQRIGKSVMDGDAPHTALAVVSAAAVMREGGEAVFFLFGAAQTVHEDGATVLTGASLGVLLGVLTGYMIYRGLVRIPLRHLFGVIGWLLIVVAAGMASQAVENLVDINMLPALANPLWNLSTWLPQSSAIGEVLHVMTGYSDQPSGMQVLVFVAALLVMSLIHQRLRSLPRRPAGQETRAAT